MNVMKSLPPAFTVKQIHEEFDTAQERLLEEAQRIVDRPHIELTLKAGRLNRLGFGSSKPALIGQKVVDNYNKKTEFIKSVSYFAQHYPFNKFITEDEVKRLCEKYGLVFSDANKYIGDIPERNIDEIEKFILKKEDWVEPPFSLWDSMAELSMFSFYSNRVTTEEPKKKEKEKVKPAFKIVAPVKDFDTKNMVLKGYKLELNLPDPIVLQPVNGGYLIVSKWGLESNDETLVNEINN